MSRISLVKIYESESDVYGYDIIESDHINPTPIEIRSIDLDQLSYLKDPDIEHATFLGYVALYMYHPNNKDFIGNLVGKLFLTMNQEKPRYFILTNHPECVTVVKSAPFMNFMDTNRYFTYVYNDNGEWIKVDDNRRTVYVYDTDTDTIVTKKNVVAKPYWLPFEGDDDTSAGRYMDTLGPYPEGAITNTSPAIDTNPLPTIDELKESAYRLNAERYSAAILKLVKDTLCLSNNPVYKEGQVGNLFFGRNLDAYIQLSGRTKYLDDAYWMFFTILNDFNWYTVSTQHLLDQSARLNTAHQYPSLETYCTLCDLPIETAISTLADAKRKYGALMKRYASLMSIIKETKPYLDCYKLVHGDTITYKDI